MLDVIFKFVFVVPFPKLLTKNFDLLAQIVVLLVLVDSRTGLLLDIRFQPQHFNLLAEKLYSHFQAACGIQLTKQLASVGKIHAGILSNRICNEAVGVAGHHTKLNSLRRMLGHFQIQSIQRVSLTAKCMRPQAITGIWSRNCFDYAGQIGIALGEFCDLTAAKTGDKNAEILTLCF